MHSTDGVLLCQGDNTNKVSGLIPEKSINGDERKGDESGSKNKELVAGVGIKNEQTDEKQGSSISRNKELELAKNLIKEDDDCSDMNDDSE
ncbi:hypothetical protein FRX31_032671 [Thalictrum thalictroides]|uniref:Uncharacterized protein n=1 Tax=Thalictrum thalictroides TaxID=46969 RepID=A0A7J6UYK9_THATH|nr:hypothetical protein FRX31_032671 [Thalictrum thalictroides]